MPKSSQTASAVSTAELIEQQKQLIRRLEKEKAGAEAKLLKETPLSTGLHTCSGCCQPITEGGNIFFDKHWHVVCWNNKGRYQPPQPTPENVALREKHLGTETMPAKQNGQAKNDFLPWIGEILGNLPLQQKFTIKLINKTRAKDGQYGKQWLLDIHFLMPPAIGVGSDYTWSMRVDDPRIGQLLDLMAEQKPVHIQRQEYKDNGQTKSKIVIA